jgi:hypothetical protein
MEYVLWNVYLERLCLARARSRKKAHDLSLLAVTMTGLYRPSSTSQSFWRSAVFQVREEHFESTEATYISSYVIPIAWMTIK